MPKNIEKDLLRRLDEKTLLSLSKYSSERRKLGKVSTIVSGLIASVVGLALTVSAIFPQFNAVFVAIVSTFLGAAIAWLSYWERHKEEKRLIIELLGDDSSGLDADLKQELIEHLWVEDL